MLVLTHVITNTTASHKNTKGTNSNHSSSNYDISSGNNLTSLEKQSTGTIENYNTFMSNTSTKKEIENRTPIINSLANEQASVESFLLGLSNKNDGERKFFVKSVKTNFSSKTSTSEIKTKEIGGPEQRDIEDAADSGLNIMRELLEVKEPLWYKLGLVLDQDDPASHVANFGKPNMKALGLSQFGFAAVEASKKLSLTFPENVKNEGLAKALQSRLLQEDCPLRGRPRCPPSTDFFRTSDGTCNNLGRPWWGASLLPMQRFLPPSYDDGIQDVRRSKSDRRLPSARDISTTIHRDRNLELPTVTLMFMQWGQFVDHDLISTVKSRSFNGSIPRCCDRGGRNPLPVDIRHPSCLPIDVSEDDWILGRFGVRCLEFIRSAPATRIDCDLGWREQMNQVTSFLDGSTIYGSDPETTRTIRTFRNGKIHYGRPIGNEPLDPPDPPGGEICRSGALSTECFEGGDFRFGEQPGLTAMHTVWVRYHNKLATSLGKLNKHWNDERIFQETRKIIGALIQHITFREFLPIVVGPEVMELFELTLNRKGYYKGYDERVNPAIANSFGAAAFRFGHSLVQNTYIRFDSGHRPIFDNVSLHREPGNFDNIWRFGSVDRLLLGLVNQPSQRRDEFICEELTNNLFKHPRAPFGVDLAAINIQRGRDHGLPSYTAWRKPCGLSTVENWEDLKNVLSIETAQRLRSLYEHVDDIDLFTAGLAERPVRGGIVGPTFACIIAQQFSNLRKGDRFWYENSGFRSSFTPGQLSQFKRITFSEILCQTLRAFETVQPFVFLSADNLKNMRMSCNSPLLNKFDLAAWTEDIEPLNDNTVPLTNANENPDDDIQNRDIKDFFDFGDEFRVRRDIWEGRKRKRVTTTPKPNTPKRRYTATKATSRPNLKIPISNVTIHSVPVEKNYENYYNGYNNYNIYDEMPRPEFEQYQPIRYTTKKYYPIRDKNQYTYLFGRVPSTTPIPRTSTKTSQTPLEVNIKIQYYPPNPTRPKKKQQTIYARPQNSNGYGNGYSNSNVERPSYNRPSQVNYRPNSQSNYDDEIVIIKRPNKRPNANLGYSFSGETFVLQPVKYQQNQYNSDDTDQDQIDDIQAEPSEALYHRKPFESTDEHNSKPYVDVNFANQNDDAQYDENDSSHSGENDERPNPWQPYHDEDQSPYYGETELHDRDKDQIDRLYNTKHSERKHTSDKRKFHEDDSGPGNPYSIAYIEKLNSDKTKDRLDFKTRLVYKKRFQKPSREADDSDEGFISDDELEDNSDQDDRQEKSSYREGDLQLEDESLSGYEYEKIRLVDINVSKKKSSQTKWKPYTESNSTEEELIMPELQQNIRTSDEIPKRIVTTENIRYEQQ